jgi:hypothetical protein
MIGCAIRSKSSFNRPVSRPAIEAYIHEHEEWELPPNFHSQLRTAFKRALDSGERQRGGNRVVDLGREAGT